MRAILYPNLRKHFCQSIHFYLSVLLISAFSLLSTASANTIVVGTGSGSFSVNSMNGLNPGDTVAVMAGTYSYGSISNVHDITVTNYRGVVTVGLLYWGSNANAADMHNVHFTGTGYSGAFYGFVFNGTNSNGQFYVTLKHTDSLRMDHIDFEGAVNGGAINFSDNYFGISYNGTVNSTKLHCATFSDLKVNNCSMMMATGWNCITCSNNNIMDSIDMHNIIITNLTGAGQAVEGTITHLNAYHWNITYQGYNAKTGDIGVFYIGGNGAIHDCYMHGGRGYLARIDAFSIKPLKDSVLFYNNILLGTTTYGGLDIRCDSASIPWNGNPYFWGIGQTFVLNNTVGNKTTDDNYVTPVVLVYNMDISGTAVIVKNNLAFNDNFNNCCNASLPSASILVNYNGATGKIDSSNNAYFSGSTILNVLADTNNLCQVKAGAPIIGAGVFSPIVTTDFSGRPRLNPPTIGAEEYNGSTTGVYANAGSNQTITLPLDSVNLSGAASSVVNSTITSYTWSENSGPNAATISSPNSVNTKVNGLIAGTYIFSLKVKDANNDSSTATVTVIVNPVVYQKPVVNAGANQTITLPTNSVTLSGTAKDSTGTIVSYLWTEVSGPNTATITTPGAATTTVTGLIAGSYIFQLKVTDNNGLSGTANVTITVNPAPNQPPVVNAGANQTITLPTNSVTLSGTAKDSTGTIVSYLWTEVSGPNTATITTPGSPTTTVTGLIAGSYIFQLKVTDNNGLSGTANVTITVNPAPNQPPVANAGANQTITLPTNSVTVDGSASKDPDGVIVSFLWAKVSGPSQGSITSPTSVSTTITGLAQGNYVFSLTVKDNSGASSTDTMTVTVNPAPNQPPVANAGSSITITLPLDSATLDGSKSYDPDGTITTYSWTEISGPSTVVINGASTPVAKVTSLVAGRYIFQLTVKDNAGASSSAQVTVIVNPAGNINPTANAGANQTITLPVDSVKVDGSASIAPSGSIASYLWSQISGPATSTIVNPSNVSTTITNLVQGTYYFKLTVSDNLGGSSADTMMVTVNPAVNQPPVANAGASKSITLPVDSTLLDGTKSYDPDGTIASYKWTQVSGPSNSTIANPNLASTIVSKLVAGQYVFQLTVTDNKGATATSQVKINVLAAANQPPVANAGANQAITLPTNSVSLNGSKSYDPDGSIVSYNWVTVSGPGAATIANSNTATPTVSGLQAGSYVFKLTVADNSGATASAQVTVTVNAALVQPAPIANAGLDTTIAVPASTAILNGSASTAPGGSIVSYKWTELSGPNTAVIVSPGADITDVNSLIAGVYVFTLTITDNLGVSASDTVSVTVTDNARTSSNQSLLLYPNPAITNINVQVISDVTGSMKVMIYDIRGQLDMVREFSKTSVFFSTPINISGLLSGTYMLQVSIGKKMLMVSKFIKQ